MIKFYFALSLFFACSIRVHAQADALYQFSHDYFRSDPFAGQFSTFMQHLMKDPAITSKEKRLRSDTALFYFYGVYNNFNPFFFKPKKLEVLLEEMPFQYSDTSRSKDTLLIYQLIAYADTGQKGQADVKKEFEKIHRQYKRRFFDSNYNELKENDIITGALHNYFEPMHALSPLSVAWGNLEGTNQPVLNITLRMKTSENRAVLPVPLYNPK